MRMDPAYAKVKRMEEQLRDEHKRFAQFVSAKEFNELIAGLLSWWFLFVTTYMFLQCIYLYKKFQRNNA